MTKLTSGPELECMSANSIWPLRPRGAVERRTCRGICYKARRRDPARPGPLQEATRQKCPSRFNPSLSPRKRDDGIGMVCVANASYSCSCIFHIHWFTFFFFLSCFLPSFLVVVVLIVVFFGCSSAAGSRHFKSATNFQRAL